MYIGKVRTKCRHQGKFSIRDKCIRQLVGIEKYIINVIECPAVVFFSLGRKKVNATEKLTLLENTLTMFSIGISNIHSIEM